MAAITWSDVAAFAAGLSGVDPIAQLVILDHVNTAFDVRRFDGGEDGPRLKLARILYAAHFAAIAVAQDASGPAGPVTSESAGGMSVSYGNLVSANSGDDVLATTTWGRAFRLIIRPAGGGFAL